MFYIAGAETPGGRTRTGFPSGTSMFLTIPYASKCMVGYKVADIPAIMGSFDPCVRRQVRIWQLATG